MDRPDRNLIAALRQGPRATARALSRTLGVSELVVATRIRSLEADSELRVMALLEMGAVGFEHFVLFGIRVDDRLPDVRPWTSGIWISSFATPVVPAGCESDEPSSRS